MPTAPPRACPRCKGLVYGGRCQTCARARDQARGSAHQRGYTAAWHAFSSDWLQRFPWCGTRHDGQRHLAHSRCAQHGLQVRATCTDHILSLSLGGAHMNVANSQSLCGNCNRRKNIAHEGGFGR